MGQQLISRKNKPNKQSIPLQGFPGNLNVTATYTLTDANELQTVIEATTDADTPVNLAQHSYFNLNGQARGNILDHTLMIKGCAASS